MRARIRDSIVSILEFAEIIFKDGSKIIPFAESSVEIAQAELPSESSVEAPSEREFARLSGDDFTFEVRKDLEALEYAASQFEAWVAYLRKKLEKARQSGGVPNQEQ
jgi:hypothetical protein